MIYLFILISLVLILPVPLLLATFEKAIKFPENRVRLFVSLLCDILVNYTWMAVVFGWPNKGEYTITKRYPLLLEHTGIKGAIGELIYNYVEARVPGHLSSRNPAAHID